jgi:hypothetical protein
MLEVINSGALCVPVSIEGNDIMKIHITRNTICGGIAVTVGDVVDASESDARILISNGKAFKVEDKPKAKKKDDAGE